MFIVDIQTVRGPFFAFKKIGRNFSWNLIKGLLEDYEKFKRFKFEKPFLRPVHHQFQNFQAQKS